MNSWSDNTNVNSSWQPGNSENSKLLRDNDINTNWNYRLYMVRNADKIIQINQTNACKDIGIKCTNANKIDSTNTHPFLYKSFSDDSTPRGYENSDAKSKYILDISQQKQMITPLISEKKISIGGYLRNLF